MDEAVYNVRLTREQLAVLKERFGIALEVADRFVVRPEGRVPVGGHQEASRRIGCQSVALLDGPRGLGLPGRHLLEGDNFSTGFVVQHTARLLLQPLGKFFCGEHPMRHEPGTDNVSILDFDSVATQRRLAIFAYLPNLSQKACHYAHIESPKDHQPAVFQGFDIEMSHGERVDHGRTPLRVAPGHLPEDCPGLV